VPRPLYSLLLRSKYTNFFSELTSNFGARCGAVVAVAMRYKPGGTLDIFTDIILPAASSINF
jgi:hypothetical protein